MWGLKDTIVDYETMSATRCNSWIGDQILQHTRVYTSIIFFPINLQKTLYTLGQNDRQVGSIYLSFFKYNGKILSLTLLIHVAFGKNILRVYCLCLPLTLNSYDTHTPAFQTIINQSPKAMWIPWLWWWPINEERKKEYAYSHTVNQPLFL